MTDYSPSIKIARLFERTSKSGNRYFVGRLGMAKIAVLKSKDVAEDGSPEEAFALARPYAANKMRIVQSGSERRDRLNAD